ncbi:energy transducer TonB [Aurantiacibacter hainanensis]|uniref:energy transducer TonB n=1 Tax=Aurantiacibacter hainanensis TaxID=3076114 RepID=UPI0030C680EA
MKKLVSIAIVSAVLAAPLAAQDPGRGQPIIVQTDPSTFVSSLSHELDRQLRRVSYPGGFQQSGVVKVRFVANGHGRAEQVTLFEESGSHSMDRAALRAVHRLDRLGSNARTQMGGQDVLLSIVFATSEREAERLARRTSEENAALIASGKLEPQVLAVTMVPSARG